MSENNEEKKINLFVGFSIILVSFANPQYKFSPNDPNSQKTKQFSKLTCNNADASLHMKTYIREGIYVPRDVERISREWGQY